MANTPDGTVRLTAIDCVSHGVAGLRLNGRLLIGVRLLRNLILVALIGPSLVLPVLALGLDLWLDLPKNIDDGLEWLSNLADRFVWTPKLAVALGAMLVLWLVAGYIYCYFQAGIYGVVAEAEGQTPERRVARWGDFTRSGSARLNRYFSLANLYGAVIGGEVLLFVLGAGAVASASAVWGAFAAFGIGCVGFLPIILLVVVTGLWFEIACAELTREEASVRIASRRALEILRRRVGAVALLLVLFTAVSMAIWLALLPLSALVSFATNGSPLVLWVSRQLVAAVPGAAVETILAGSWVALVRSEALGA